MQAIHGTNYIQHGLGNSYSELRMAHEMRMYRPGEYQPIGYVHQEYPKHLHQSDGNFIVVCNEEEERTVRASGVLLTD